jgi:hypothetical protein
MLNPNELKAVADASKRTSGTRKSSKSKSKSLAQEILQKIKKIKSLIIR